MTSLLKTCFLFYQKIDIIPLDSIGKKLDPNFHQAMIEIDDDQKEPGTIIQEIQRGIYDERQVTQTLSSRSFKKN